ncbi:GMC family oxidoreductase N-terminal domain-containing protein [Alkalihalobacillus sp. LMS39]|uniref:GMC family oxidoreductase N-terminal domain-containing protein n=1 Tax=Alkalihalobacillus sp. LMS39 TaxID=2924032 RepID=UPI001FB3A2AC|nr:GMC family oxidoreductase N-terminal domain-containing protein [Alkalihalobacillus sp. LMS39]UOE96303.1 GMC family oxidoreductase N-terminal domain-containing protein [Alkalihalobacillus sp. LMS39]
MSHHYDVIIIGSGGGGAVAAKELGELGIKTIVLDAGPWYGNKKWPYPNSVRGAETSCDPDDLDVNLYRSHLTRREQDMNDPITGKLRWGPADRRRSPWYRNIPDQALLWQVAGIGGTTLHYYGNSPRAYPASINNHWPIRYEELIPYYEKVEAILPVEFAPTTSKEQLFYYGAEKAGFSLIPTLDVTEVGYRPQPNAILPPNERLMDENYSLEEISHMEGCTLSGHCGQGCPYGPSVEKAAKRSTNVSYVPLAMKTGNVTFRPNAFATKVLTEKLPNGEEQAFGVQYRDTWTGETEEVQAKIVIMAAGCVETPRLWLNSDLPFNHWVGRGLTNHYMDAVTGTFDEQQLMKILGTPSVYPFIGHTSGARLDYPGLGMIENLGESPGLSAQMLYGFSQAGYNKFHSEQKADEQGRLVGTELKEAMNDYRNSLSLLIITGDEVQYNNRVELDPHIKDEHGQVPIVKYTPSKQDEWKRNELVKIGMTMLEQAGAKSIHRSDLPPNLYIHLESTMRMGYVVDSTCEAYQVKRLFIADNSVHYNSIGGVNPTLTTQALTTRTIELMVEKYF